MRRVFLAAVIASGAALASEYRLDPGASVSGGMLEVEPVVHGPPGAQVRYEIRTVREGAGGRSTSSQSGGARLGSDGAARLASTRVSVTPPDRYAVHVKLFEGARVVAEETVRHPD